MAQASQLSECQPFMELFTPLPSDDVMVRINDGGGVKPLAQKDSFGIVETVKMDSQAAGKVVPNGSGTSDAQESFPICSLSLFLSISNQDNTTLS